MLLFFKYHQIQIFVWYFTLDIICSDVVTDSVSCSQHAVVSFVDDTEITTFCSSVYQSYSHTFWVVSTPANYTFRVVGTPSSRTFWVVSTPASYTFRVVVTPGSHTFWVVSTPVQLQSQHTVETHHSSYARHSNPTRCWWYIKFRLVVIKKFNRCSERLLLLKNDMVAVLVVLPQYPWY